MTTSYEQAKVLEDAGDMRVGGTVRVLCPWCHGGKEEELTLSMTRRADGVLYHCHRNKCGVSGFIPTSAYSLPCAVAEPKELQGYTGTLDQLTDADYDFFWSKYELNEEALNGRVLANDRDEYVLPIVWDGYERGYNVRQPWPGGPRKGRQGQPKAKVWMHSPKPVQSLYGDVSEELVVPSLVIVEDQLSAIKVTRAGAIAVAIMGTHLNPERVREIAMLRPYEVIIALDKDATAKAFQHARDYGLAFNKTRVAILEQDIKDTPLLDIPAVLGL